MNLRKRVAAGVVTCVRCRLGHSLQLRQVTMLFPFRHETRTTAIFRLHRNVARVDLELCLVNALLLDRMLVLVLATAHLD